MTPETSFFAEFAISLGGDDPIARLRGGVIGEGVPVEGPFGTRKLVYADYVASGRALRQIEGFMMDEVLPYYANSHTEASFCGERMTRMRREARAVIARLCGADERFATVFAGAGATAGLNRLVALLGVPEAVAEGRGSQFSAGMALALGTLFCTVAGYFALLPMMAAARAETLQPRARMAAGLGPTKMSPACRQASAKSAFSDRKP